MSATSVTSVITADDSADMVSQQMSLTAPCASL